MAKMRRFLALFLAVALCAGQLIVPTAAAEEEQIVLEVNAAEGVKEETAEVEEAPVVVEEAPAAAPQAETGAVVKSNEYVDPVTGNTVKESSTYEEKYTETSDENSTTQKLESSWTEKKEETEQTEIDSFEQEINGEKHTTNTTSGSTTTTTTTGSETDEQEIFADPESGTWGEDGKLSHQESTTTETKDSSTEKTDGVLIGKLDEKDEDPTYDDPTNESNESDKDPENEDDWEDGKGALENQTSWSEQTPETGSSLKDGESDPVKTGVVTPDEILDGNPETKVEITDLNPNGEWKEGTYEITEEDLLAGKYPDIYDPEKGGTITPKMVDGKQVGWIVTRTHEEITSGRTETEYTETDNQETIQYKSEIVKVDEYEKLVDAGPVESKNDKGQTIVTYYERITDAKGNPGYRKVVELAGEPTVERSGTALDPVKDADIIEKFKDEQKSEKFWFVPPANVPTDKEENHSDGSRVVTKVTPILADADTEFYKAGDTIGYKIDTVNYAADGEIARSESREIYGTTHKETVLTTLDPTTLETVTTTVKTDRDIDEIFTTEHSRDVDVALSKTETYETTIVTESDTYQLVETAEGLFFLYQGRMYDVRAVGSNANRDHNMAGPGTVSMTGDAEGAYTVKDDDIQTEEQYGNKSGELHSGQWTASKTANYADWTLVGNGLVSGLFIKDNGGAGEDADGSSHQAQQFMIKKGDEIRYVYCVEMGQSIDNNGGDGSGYGSNIYSDDVDDAKTAGVAGNAYWTGNVDELRSVCLNGFWGTASGTGSLEAVRELLRSHGYTDAAKNITAGEALAATQAAIWEYGAADGYGFADEDFVYYSNGDAKQWPDEKLVGNVYDLRKLLIDLAEDDAEDGKSGAAQAITTDKISGGGIAIKDRVETNNDDGTTSTTDMTDLSFKLDVSRSSINNDLKVSVINNKGEVVKTCRLAGDDKGLNLFKIEPVNGVYTIPDVELTEGVYVTLKLEGTQVLDQGIFVYNNEDWQDFVGLSSKEHDVNIEFKMEFKVEDPAFYYTGEVDRKLRTDSVKSTAAATRHDEMTVISTYSYEQVKTDVNVVRNVRGQLTKETVLEKNTLENLRWDAYYGYLMTEETTGGGGGEGGNGGEGTFIGDEMVPLAAAPKTGDMTVVWALISMFSLGGAAVLSLKKKED